MSHLPQVEVIVVGAGAAGMIAAKRAAESGQRVALLEKNDKPGLKILISGGGKCNLTHDGSMDEIRAQFRQNEGRFLKPAFYKFTNQDFLAILHAQGLETYVRPDGRIFPVEPANAKFVVELLTNSVRLAGVKLLTGYSVSGIAVEDGVAVGVWLGDEVYLAKSVIVAVGGSSYPATGTTGDGWRWLAELGHKIVPLRAALAPLYLDDVEPDWSGVSLRDVYVRARFGVEEKVYARWRGDLLFTHKGLSGPCALGISREIAEKIAGGLPNGGIVDVDLVPDQDYPDLQARLKEVINADLEITMLKLVDPFLPNRLCLPFLATAGMSSSTRGRQVSPKLLNRLVNAIKGWSLGGVRAVPLERGEVVAGGVSLDEVDSVTMASKLIRNLYLCGEVLDIAGPVGGYNLQAAWSTGFVAGESAGIQSAKR